jgi:hypothetical protein
MIRIAITAAAFDAIAETLPFGSTPYEAKPTADGGYFIWLEKGALARLDALRQPGRATARSSYAWPRSRRTAPEDGGASEAAAPVPSAVVARRVYLPRH